MLDRYVDAASGVLAEVTPTQGEALEEAACVNPILDPALSPAAGVIDNRCPAGDAALTLASGDRVGPLTTVVGAAVVAALCARVAELLAPYLARFRRPR
jgi:uncharacterized phosphosugar-binding protein